MKWYYEICFFLLQYPERVYTVKEGVTSLDFSRANPNLLAVSLIKINIIDLCLNLLTFCNLKINCLYIVNQVRHLFMSLIFMSAVFTVIYSLIWTLT